jgi:hypothetical protein
MKMFRQTKLMVGCAAVLFGFVIGNPGSRVMADDFAGYYPDVWIEYDDNITDGVSIQTREAALTVNELNATSFTAQITSGSGTSAVVACGRVGMLIQNTVNPLLFPGVNLSDFVMVSDGTNKAAAVVTQATTPPFGHGFSVGAWSERAGAITIDDLIGTWSISVYGDSNLRDPNSEFDLTTGLTGEVTVTGPDTIQLSARSPEGAPVNFPLQVLSNAAVLAAAPYNSGAGMTHTLRICSDGTRMAGVMVTAELYDPADVSVTLLFGERISPPVVRDLAVISIKPSKVITLTGNKTNQTKYVRVTIQNRGNADETITDLATLAELVTLEVESVGQTCPSPVAVLVEGSPQRPLPVTLKPKQKFTVVYKVTYDCANDPAKNIEGDFRYIARVDRAVLDGLADMDPADDVCPHDAPSGGVDPVNPAIKDKGAGGKKPDGTLGADVLTDVVWK